MLERACRGKSSQLGAVFEGTSSFACDGAFAIDMNQFHTLNWTATGCSPAPGQNNPAGFLSNMGTTVNARCGDGTR